MTVRQLCDQGIAALVALYGECHEEDYEPKCFCCKVSVIVRDMRKASEDDEEEYAPEGASAADAGLSASVLPLKLGSRR
jgi:hypothetical protein